MKITESSLVYDTSSLDELLLTFSYIPKQLMKDPNFGSETGHTAIAKQSFTFFLELNHDTLTIWYQIDHFHFAYTAKSLVPYLKLCGVFWLKHVQAYSQPATDCSLREGKLSITRTF